MSRIILLLAAISTLAWVDGQPFPYELVIEFHQYSNPGHALISGDCCDNANCTDDCISALSLCIRSGGTNQSDFSCFKPLGIIGGDSVTFTDTVGDRENPVVLRANILPHSGYQLFIDSSARLGVVQYFKIDQTFIDIPTSALGQCSPPQNYPGETQLVMPVTINLSYFLRCSPNYTMCTVDNVKRCVCECECINGSVSVSIPVPQTVLLATLPESLSDGYSSSKCNTTVNATSTFTSDFTHKTAIGATSTTLAPSTMGSSSTTAAPSTMYVTFTTVAPSTVGVNSTMGTPSTMDVASTTGAPSTMDVTSTAGAPSTMDVASTTGAPSTMDVTSTAGVPSTMDVTSTTVSPSTIGATSTISATPTPSPSMGVADAGGASVAVIAGAGLGALASVILIAVLVVVGLAVFLHGKNKEPVDEIHVYDVPISTTQTHARQDYKADVTNPIYGEVTSNPAYSEVTSNQAYGEVTSNPAYGEVHVTSNPAYGEVHVTSNSAYGLMGMEMKSNQVYAVICNQYQ